MTAVRIRPLPALAGALALGLALALVAGGAVAHPAAAGPGSTGHSLGPPDAPVVVTEFSDFGCPYCAVFARTVFPELRRDYIDAGRVRWLHVPFVLGLFPNSEAAVTAAECAADQDGYWRMHELLFRRQVQWKDASTPASLFRRYGEEVGLDPARLGTCMEAGTRDEVARGGDMAMVVGVRVTPTFFIDGKRLEGAVSLEEFRRILDEALDADE